MDFKERIVFGVLSWVSIIVLFSFNSAAQSPYDSAFGATCCIIWAIIDVLLAVGVYYDAERIGMSGVVWGLVVLISGILGVILYFMVRTPPEQEKEQSMEPITFEASPPSETKIIKEKEIIKEVIKVRCPYCGALVDQGVDRCPNCGAPLR